MSSKASEISPIQRNIYRRMYYIRVIFAIIAGVLSGILKLEEGLGLILGSSFFILTYLLFRFGIKSIYTNVKDTKKFYTTGIFSYFLIWYVIWVIVFNIIWMR
ncbi:MAG: hypothetical protein QXI49_03405 [Candidatus Methanomethylicaceae archaeon]